MKAFRTVGIDYSLTSPSVCIFEGEPTFENSKIYYLTDKKKCLGKFGNLQGCEQKLYSSPQERHNNICEWVFHKLRAHDRIFIEGYSMGSNNGRVFDIAENTSILKHYLWKEDYQYELIPPTVIKKFATGKGNANKEKMQEAFMLETGVDIKNILSLTEKAWNPSSDIIDSFYIGKKGYDLIKESLNG